MLIKQATAEQEENEPKTQELPPSSDHQTDSDSAPMGPYAAIPPPTTASTQTKTTATVIEEEAKMSDAEIALASAIRAVTTDDESGAEGRTFGKKKK